jgi:hypothetical protein
VYISLNLKFRDETPLIDGGREGEKRSEGICKER